MPRKLRCYVEGSSFNDPFEHATHLRALVAGWLKRADPDLSTRIHATNQPKPYTISPIWSDPDRMGSAWFEVSVLDDAIAEPMLAGCRQCQPDIRLGSQDYRLRGPEIRAVADWEALREPAPANLCGFDLQMLSPTAAHHPSGPCRKAIVLPSPELYFGTWLDRWNRWADRKIAPVRAEALMNLVETQIGVSACSGGTRAEHLDPGRPFIGFEGNVQFAILKPQSVPPQSLTDLAALARFSTFCGTGVETMRGMGQTVLVKLKIKPQTRRRT
jgi:CRISPR-associated endoribonuclease Cas6